MDGNAQRKLSSKQYERLSDWAEHTALIALGSMVVQQFIIEKTVMSWSVLTGVFITAFMYGVAYRWLKHSE